MRVREAINNPKMGHYLVKEEVGQVYSGFMIIQEKDGVPLYKVRSRLFAGFEKMHVPERSAGSAHRKCWPIGILTRVNQLDPYANPHTAEAWDIVFHHWREIMRPQFGEFMDLITAAVETMPISESGLSLADREVLDDPEKIHYKWLPEELSPEVRNMIVNKIPFAEFGHIPASYYNGVIYERTEEAVLSH